MKNVIHLPEFGFLAITGRDALKFLQGYSTCDLATVTPGSPGIGATCNIQGRMLANYRIAAIEAGFLLRMHHSLVAPTIAFLKKYIVFSKAELIDESTSYHCYGHTGAFDVPEGALMVAIDTAGERQECWSTQSPSITPDQTQLNAWHQAELAAGLVWLDITSVEEYIPQMLNLQNFDGISFKKGCYLGQEIVARMQYRGQLKRKLHRGQATHQVKPGDLIISATGSTLGKIVASVGQEFLAVTSIAGTDTTFQLSSGEKLALSPVS
ncbi:MAG: folate-binding protein YgfZ [Candidatus Pseudothioglobus sp.]|jgi:folate-binding protein YgfZ